MATKLKGGFMAKCPKCGAIWLWDWCGDCYVNPDNKPYETIDLANTGSWEGALVQCTCGKVNSVIVVCDCGGGPMNTKEWENIDWEQDEHSFNPPRGKEE
jgi:hypothetical protein